LETHRRDIVKELAQELNNVINILITLDKSQPFAPRKVSNDIKSKELEPLAEVTALPGVGEHVFRLVEPVGER
jgi:hypothetical protein